MTVSKLTLPNLASGVEYIEKLGFKCDATLAIGTSWPDSTIPVFMREVGKLTDYYIMNSNIELCTMLNFDFRQIFTPIDDNYRFCGAGIDLVCFDTYGNSYPCQGFAPISIGETSRNYLNFDEKTLILPIAILANTVNGSGCAPIVMLQICKVVRISSMWTPNYANYINYVF